MIRPAYRLLTFDVTNTILKFRESVGAVYSRIATLHGIHLDPNELHVNFRKNWQFQNVDYPNYGHEFGFTPEHWWSQLVKRTFVDSGYRGPLSKLTTVAYVLFHYYGRKECMEIIHNADRVLDELKSSGMTLGVISNFDGRLQSLLSAHDLLKRFDFVLVSANVGVCKPQPEIFHLALDKARVRGEDAAHVGDNVKLDYHAARAAGLSAFLINQELCSVAPSLHDVHTNNLFTDINELRDYLLEGKPSSCHV